MCQSIEAFGCISSRHQESKNTGFNCVMLLCVISDQKQVIKNYVNF